MRQAGLSIDPSVRPSFRFLKIKSLTFSNFWRCFKKPYESVCIRAGFFLKKRFSAPEFGETWPKVEFLDLLKNVVNIFL